MSKDNVRPEIKVKKPKMKNNMLIMNRQETINFLGTYLKTFGHSHMREFCNKHSLDYIQISQIRSKKDIPTVSNQTLSKLFSACGIGTAEIKKEVYFYVNQNAELPPNEPIVTPKNPKKEPVKKTTKKKS